MWKKQFFQSCKFPNPPYELTGQPLAHIFFLSVEDNDPLSAIEAMRKPENLPQQYRSGMYEGSKTVVKQFVFILNDTADDRKFQDSHNSVRAQFDSSAIFEIRMSGNRGQEEQKAPLPDQWKDYTDIDLRTFDPSLGLKGQGFTQNDRTLTGQVVRRIIEKYLLPQAVMKIQNIEANVRKTRAGKFNMIKNFFKETERGESDGLKATFRMNRNELELRNLIDLAFVIQDYQTTRAYVEFPADDFRKIKAFQHAAHCDELKLFSRLVLERDYPTLQYKELV